MDEQAIFIFCLCDEIVKELHIHDDSQCHMTSSEIMTFVLISALHYQCNYKKTRLVLSAHRYFSKMLSESRLNRKIHLIPCEAWMTAFTICKALITSGSSKEFIVDSFPVPVCQNNKIFRCKLLKGKEYHGYNASKKWYFYGIKVHMIIDTKGLPIEFIFTPGSETDIRAFKRFECDLPVDSRIYADKAYNDYMYEDLMNEILDVRLIPKRKTNMKRANNVYDDYLLSAKRNRIETTFSSIVSLMPRSIHAVTTKGFYLKVFFFIFGYTVKQLMA
jgi:hypothetical protein